MRDCFFSGLYHKRLQVCAGLRRGTSMGQADEWGKLTNPT